MKCLSACVLARISHAPRFTSLVLIAILSSGCVTAARYDTAVQDAQSARGELEQSRAEHDARTAELTRQLEHATAEVQEREARLSAATVESHNLQTKLDEATAIDQRLRGELERLGKNVDQLLADRGTIAHALDEAKARLAELRKAQAEAEARAALTRQLAAKFKAATQGGPLAVVTRDGRVVLQLPSDVAFESGRATLKPDAQRALASLAPVLQSVEGRKFQVAGHTDNIPPDGGRGSNWDLSTARAVAVVRYLVSRGVAGSSLSAAGYAEFSPLYPNDTPQNRAQNRRIELTLLPTADEFIRPTGP
jgi:chemotaxis protein MotB